ncbi:hypothetical protein M9458_030733 [Cirrhinus mrigala]|uniref:Uncharacterized protein n=1 Tax=Cirrhinus mrigala TaxID=683832 RepID=A0ABD0PL58_CIRMR
MPNVNASESTSPPDGGIVEKPYETTPLTRSDGVSVTPVANSSNTQTNSQTEFAFLPDGSHLKTQQDVDPDGGKLDPSTQIQTDTNVKEVTSTCSTENTSQTERERVIRELSITSTSFIGPACRPEPSIEQELSEFYKELEEVDKVEVNADTKSGDQHDKPESDQSNGTNIPVVVTDHGRAYRPYPDPHERNQKDPKRWRPRLQCNTNDFGRGGYPEPWYPPPPWVSPDPSVQFFPPPTSGAVIMYPPDMRPQENIVFNSLHVNNNSWGPWERPPLPSNSIPDSLRNINHLHHTGSSIIMKMTNISILIMMLCPRIWKIYFGQVGKTK